MEMDVTVCVLLRLTGNVKVMKEVFQFVLQFAMMVRI